MSNFVILPVIIPVITGLLLVMIRKNIRLQRLLSAFSVLGLIFISLYLISEIKTNGVQILPLGGWKAPFGVTMVIDMFSALLLFTTSIVAFCCLLYAFNSIERERECFYFYPLFLFLIAGVNGSFITGDMFNLFVCFEVMLVSSYVLISIGGTERQLNASVKYILVNILSSFLFLIAISYLYAICGTLNMAHLSLRVAEAGQEGLMITVAILFLIVFSMKAALFLFFWLPNSYSAPPTAVAAIFAALLTKVGIYAIIRTFSLIFYHQPEITHLFIGILAAVTMLLGALGTVAYGDIRRILAYNVIVSVGFILAGFASFTTEGLTGSLYYFIHDMIGKALVFLLGGTIILLTGTSRLKEMSGLIRLHPMLGWMFFTAALALSGIPPLSGFLGKIMVTQGTFYANYYWLGGIGLFTSLFVLYSLMKIFMSVFWGYTEITIEEEKGTTKGLLLPLGILTALTILLGLGAEEIHEYVDLAVEVLMNPSIYFEAVLGANPKV